MTKEKKYELIWSLIMIGSGIILSLIGYLLFPIVALVVFVGIGFLIYGVVSTIKTIMKK